MILFIDSYEAVSAIKLALKQTSLKTFRLETILVELVKDCCNQTFLSIFSH